ncbi:helix-turn-helix transcriptional regulator [Idiomarina xiamenensis]|uniref:AraC family transcriptional regulator n=1 Tax=Idiomarina xiamenensis 10-D-4 TaxID=740709 RepID=K2KSB6_9GAMM|nr:helix-turn-helix transcriptional regulator [Idiomarina xiamenensis]EKE85244.1 AraC family transcriptional regulator [Idiomarina xiamenensis 10-D-4]
MAYQPPDIIPARGFSLDSLQWLSPPPVLAPWVQCIWHAANGHAVAAGIPEKLYPDGGSSLTFTLTATQVSAHYFHHTHVMRKSWPLSTQQISIRFLAGGARALLGINLDDFENIDIDLLQTPFAQQASLRRLAEQLITLDSAAQLQLILHWLMALAQSALPLPRQLPAILKYAATTLTPPQQLATQHGLSRRTLERQVRKYVGFSPQQLYRYWQIRQARQRLMSSNDSLTDIALRCGYFDQAHFTNVFHEQTLETPLAYRQRKQR